MRNVLVSRILRVDICNGQRSSYTRKSKQRCGKMERKILRL